MKVVITGGSGQLGTVVLQRLLRDRSIEQVVNIDLRPPALPGHKLKNVCADVRDPEIGQHFAGCDALIHLAFVVTQHKPRELFDSINIGGSKNVFRAAAAAGLSQIIYSSSIAAYGVVPGHRLPITEETPRIYQPDFAYSATKFTVEAFLDEFEREHPEMAIVRLRPSILFGRSMEHQLGTMLRQRLLFSTGTTPMVIVWDEDVADAVMLALRKRAHGAFNLCADALLQPPDLARAGGLRHVHVSPQAAHVASKLAPYLKRLSSTPAPDPAWLKNTDVDLTNSTARAREVLGWQPRYPTAQAVIRHYIDTVPRRLDLRLKAFFRAVAAGAGKSPPEPGLQGISERIHLALSGPGGGDRGLIIEDCRLRITQEIPRPPTAVLRMSDRTLLDLLAGRTDLGAAQLTGKLRVDGEPRAAMILGGIIARFKQSATLPGAPGLVARALQTWLSRGATSPETPDSSEQESP